MKAIFNYLFRIAELIAAILLAVIFFTFLIQIFTRYAANIAWLIPIPPISDWMLGLKPLGWTVNLISLLWVWAIFFGCSFIVREHEHIAFDIIYLSSSKKIQRIMALISSFILVGIMIYSFPAIWDLVFQNRLMELKKIQTLRIPISGDKIAIKWLFAAFVLFMVMTIIRYLIKAIAVIRGKYNPTTHEDLKKTQTETEENT